jgi:hypothetical protein
MLRILHHSPYGEEKLSPVEYFVIALGEPSVLHHHHNEKFPMDGKRVFLRRFQQKYRYMRGFGKEETPHSR